MAGMSFEDLEYSTLQQTHRVIPHPSRQPLSSNILCQDEWLGSITMCNWSRVYLTLSVSAYVGVHGQEERTNVDNFA